MGSCPIAAALPKQDQRESSLVGALVLGMRMGVCGPGSFLPGLAWLRWNMVKSPRPYWEEPLIIPAGCLPWDSSQSGILIQPNGAEPFEESGTVCLTVWLLAPDHWLSVHSNLGVHKNHLEAWNGAASWVWFARSGLGSRNLHLKQECQVVFLSTEG